jgi:hypothetical protein
MNQGIFFRPIIGFLAALICGIAMGAWFDGFIPWVMLAVMLSSAHMLRAIAHAKRNLVLAPWYFFSPWAISPFNPGCHLHYRTNISAIMPNLFDGQLSELSAMIR